MFTSTVNGDSVNAHIQLRQDIYLQQLRNGTRGARRPGRVESGASAPHWRKVRDSDSALPAPRRKLASDRRTPDASAAGPSAPHRSTIRATAAPCPFAAARRSESDCRPVGGDVSDNIAAAAARP
ncbi:hypothetical protein GCM10009848_20340 [Micromonospora lupini]